jgi:hypothetical protein
MKVLQVYAHWCWETCYARWDPSPKTLHYPPTQLRKFFELAERDKLKKFEYGIWESNTYYMLLLYAFLDLLGTTKQA